MRLPHLSRVPGLLGLAAIAASCGGSPTSPASSSSPAAPVVLPGGNYVLTLATGGGSGGPFTTFLCLTVGAGGPAAVTVGVRVEADGGGWLARADSGTLSMRLAPSGRQVVGTAVGTARESQDVGVTVGRSDGSEAQVVGEPIGTATLRGSIDDVSFWSAGGSYTCSDNSWILVPR